MPYERRSPDYTAQVAEVARRFPREWDLADKEKHGSRTDDFVRILAWELHQVDANVGLNGKRGNVHDPSHDALAYKNPSAPGGAEVIDFIIGSGHRPAWQDATIPPAPHPMNDPSRHPPEGVLGAFIQPEPHGLPGGSTGGGGGGTGLPPVDLAEFRAALADLLARVAALEARPAGLTEEDLRGIRSRLDNLAVPALNTNTRGSSFLAHFHETPAVRVVDLRSLPPDKRPKE